MISYYIKLLRFTSFLVFAFVFTLAFGQNKYYCDPTATGANNGSSWTDAYTTIQQCLNDENLGAGDTIFLAAQTFSEDNITLEWDDDDFVFSGAGIDATIIDANHADGSVFVCDLDGDDLTFEKMTIREGGNISGSATDGGGGIYYDNNGDNLTIKNVKFYDCETNSGEYGGGVNFYNGNTLTITNCAFDDCDVSTTTSSGGAIHIDGDNSNISNSTFSNCDGPNGGGAIFNSGDGTHVIDSCIFHTNSANDVTNGNGGAVYVMDGNLTITECTFYNNTSNQDGSAFYAQYAMTSLTMKNCLFYENTNSGGNGACYDDYGGTFVNCTFADNADQGFMTDDASSTVRNCISFGNTGNDFEEGGIGTINLDNCIYGTKSGTVNTDAGCSIIDPLFVNAASDNYGIQYSSPAKDAGESGGTTPTVDITEANRIHIPDIGAFEHALSCSYPTSQASSVDSANVTTSAARISWSRGDGSNVLVVVKASSDPTDPTDGVPYTANATFGSGDDVGSSSYVVYNGTGTFVDVTGLQGALKYYVEVWEYSNTGPCYKTSPATDHFITDSIFLYVNDGSTDGDRWCNAIGDNVGGDGSVDAPFATIQHIMDNYNLNQGHVIKVDAGTWTGADAETILDFDDDHNGFIIMGADSSKTFIGSSTKRAFSFENSNNDNIIIQDLTINDCSDSGSGTSNGGAGINCHSSFSIENLRLIRVHFKNNHSDNYGGAIYLGPTSSISIDSCIFTGNNCSGSTIDQGGALFVDGGATTSISYSTFTGNYSATGGGAIAYEDASSIDHVVKYCTFSGNYYTDDANNGGGAIFVGSGNNVRIRQSNFTGNYDSGSDDGGGAIYVESDGTESLTYIDTCKFTGNYCDDPGRGDGGAIAYYTDGATSSTWYTSYIRGCTFSENYADDASGNGGAIAILGYSFATSANQRLHILNSTFDNNYCNGDGGTIITAPRTRLHISNSPITRSYAAKSGGAMYLLDADSINITNVNFINDSCGTTTNEKGGGAIYVDPGLSAGNGDVALYIENCLFDNCDSKGANADGGAILYFQGETWITASQIRKSIFRNCSSQDDGGAVFFVISGTTETDTSSFVNCLFHDNTAADRGSAIYVDDFSQVSLYNCTVTENTNTDATEAAVQINTSLATSPELKLYNTIIWNNSANEVKESGATVVNMDYCVHDSGELDGDGITNSNNLTSTPNFIDPTIGGFAPQTSGSSAYDAASASYAPSDDIIDVSRPQNTADDIGAFEAVSSCSTPSTQASGGSVSVDGNEATITWTRGNGDGVIVVVKDGATQTDPTNGVDFTASANWAAKSGTTGSSSYVVYKGTGTSVTITNLDYASTYNVGIYEYTSVGRCYNATELPKSFTTDSIKYYVNDGATTDDIWCSAIGSDVTGTGTTAKPYATIQKVMDMHQLAKGHFIMVDAGTYAIGNGEQIDPDNTDLDFGVLGASKTLTILDGAKIDRIFNLVDNGDITIKDLTIQDGFEDNESESHYNGGGIYWNADNSTLVLSNIFIKNCSTRASGSGGGIYFSGTNSRLKMTNSRITKSNSNAGGGIYYSSGHSLYLNKVTIDSCETESGAAGGSAIYSNGNSKDTLINCLIYDNDASLGEFSYYIGGGTDAEVYNCTFYSNASGDDGGIGVNSGTANVVNCIMFSNGADDLESTATGGTLTTSYSMFYSTSKVNESTVGLGVVYETTITNVFTDEAIRDLTLKVGTGAINTGTTGGMVPSVDIRGYDRDAQVDMGAYEYDASLLPIELLSFNARYEEEYEEVLIDWVTGSELNNDYFDIQRKKDGGKWSSIDRVEGAGNSNINLYYSAVDANPLGGISHYRLKQVDFDGGYNYSSVSSVTTGFMSSVSSFNVYADEGGINIQLQDNKRSYYKLEIIAITGQIVHRQMLNSDEGLNVYQITKNIGRGIYQVVLSNQSEIYSKKLVLQH